MFLRLSLVLLICYLSRGAQPSADPLYLLLSLSFFETPTDTGHIGCECVPMNKEIEGSYFHNPYMITEAHRQYTLGLEKKVEINHLSEWSCGWREKIQRECQDLNHRKKAAFRSTVTILTLPIRKVMLVQVPCLSVAAEQN